MNILVIGSGGREHTICWSLAKSPKVEKLYCISGNAGIAEIAECHNISVMDFEGIYSFLESHKDISLTFVAPDDPLSAGLVDFLLERGHKAFGPSKRAALIEGSKAFSKWLMKKYGIPTADYAEFDDYDKAVSFAKTSPYPLVVKADGLALGKGVVICNNFDEANIALKEMMIDACFSEAGKKVIIEEFLSGKEVSILAFTDGKTVVPMVSSQDHKRALDNDEGLNTGGMGTFSPSIAYTKDMEKGVMERILIPTIRAMESEDRIFKGVLYFGLMITKDGIKVIEYNARLGDPEAQVVLPRLKTDLVDIIEAIMAGRLDKIKIEWKDERAVCVILASGGYPKAYKKGLPITVGEIDKDILLFHAGTDRDKNGCLVTNGGRVLGVSALGQDIETARKKAYNAVDKINFDNKHFRKDIGIKL